MWMFSDEYSQALSLGPHVHPCRACPKCVWLGAMMSRSMHRLQMSMSAISFTISHLGPSIQAFTTRLMELIVFSMTPVAPSSTFSRFWLTIVTQLLVLSPPRQSIIFDFLVSNCHGMLIGFISATRLFRQSINICMEKHCPLTNSQWQSSFSEQSLMTVLIQVHELGIIVCLSFSIQNKGHLTSSRTFHQFLPSQMLGYELWR